MLGTLREQKQRALEGEPRPSGWMSSRRDCGQRETALHAEHSKVIHKEMENQSDSGRRRLSLKTQTAGTAKLIGAVNSPSTAIKTKPAGTVLQQIWGVVVNVCVLCG